MPLNRTTCISPKHLPELEIDVSRCALLCMIFNSERHQTPRGRNVQNFRNPSNLTKLRCKFALSLKKYTDGIGLKKYTDEIAFTTHVQPGGER